ncbi:AMP-binding protein [Methylocystis heyeri]|uniref:Long-chain-fatty-acid--CoA ligase n=1 Tax=Methylocystis heyeri TaxID=391905 RepID=A0A6B8KFI5_9HYPH|nr:class I adenylate-forming enzyme family protein [Methylocystis heyeri]QGM47086.1 AMP-binding protein [Methylocystis heyeri]
MNAAPPETLRALLRSGPGLRFETAAGSLLGDAPRGHVRGAAALAGRSVLIGARSQLAAARALVELDGLAARLVICPPDFTAERLASAIEQANVEVVASDDPQKDFGVPRPVAEIADCSARQDESACSAPLHSQWLLPTSGTTGAPKLVAHSLASLLGAIKAPGDARPPVWATFYDIRRYGGLQIFLRACVSGAVLLIAEAEETLDEFILRCRSARVTHVSGTPSHWRKLLMHPGRKLLEPEYIRLSGEIADRAILSALREAYPGARIVHAYASTEAGVGFEVTDEMEGFPASFLDGCGEVELRLRDGSLHLRSPRTAARYVGRDDLKLLSEDGFVDTDDMVERIGDRCFFKGRRAGVINIGGLKVHPEEIERVINADERVRMSRVGARRNPISGNIVVADVVLKDAADGDEETKREILESCRAQLPRHMVPAVMRFVPHIEVLASGKLARNHA